MYNLRPRKYIDYKLTRTYNKNNKVIQKKKNKEHLFNYFFILCISFNILYNILFFYI
jgi:hypothetical protein